MSTLETTLKPDDMDKKLFDLQYIGVFDNLYQNGFVRLEDPLLGKLKEEIYMLANEAYKSSHRDVLSIAIEAYSHSQYLDSSNFMSSLLPLKYDSPMEKIISLVEDFDIHNLTRSVFIEQMVNRLQTIYLVGKLEAQRKVLDYKVKLGDQISYGARHPVAHPDTYRATAAIGFLIAF